MRVFARELARLMTAYSMTPGELDEVAIDAAYAMYLGVAELERQRAQEQIAAISSVWDKPESRRVRMQKLD